MAALTDAAGRQGPSLLATTGGPKPAPEDAKERVSRAKQRARLRLATLGAASRQMQTLLRMSKARMAIQTLSQYVPDFVLEQVCKTGVTPGFTADHIRGVVMIADISGFSKLAEALSRKSVAPEVLPAVMTQARLPLPRVFGRMESTSQIRQAARAARQRIVAQETEHDTLAKGAERLQGILNDYLGRLVDAIISWGGDVVRIAGDAVIVLFGSSASSTTREVDSGDMTRAVGCALHCVSMLDQQMVSDNLMRLHIGIGAGDVSLLTVGGFKNRWEFLLAGPAMAQLSEALNSAEPGQVALSRAASAFWNSADRRVPHPWDIITGDNGCNVFVKTMDMPQPLQSPTHSAVSIRRNALMALATGGTNSGVQDAVRCFVPDPVVSNISAARLGWIAGVHRVTVMFVKLDCAEFVTAADNTAASRAQAMFSTVQTSIYLQDGVIKEFSVDDKGTVVVAAFGVPPNVHEDDEVRAAKVALELVQLLANQAVKATIGLATGIVFSASMGTELRKEYAFVGSCVILAARLMCAQSNPGVLVDVDTFNGSNNAIDYQQLPSIRVKGSDAPVVVYSPIKAKSEMDSLASLDMQSQHLVDRHSERQQLKDLADELWRSRKGGWIVVEGPAGVGKSHVVDASLAAVDMMGLVVLRTVCDPVSATTPLHIWNSILVQIFCGSFGQMRASSWNSELVTKTILEALPPELAALAFLLNDILPVKITDPSSPLSVAGRSDKLAELVFALVSAAAQDALECLDCSGRMLIVIEDANWLDPHSCALIQRFHRQCDSSIMIWTVARSAAGDDTGAFRTAQRTTPDVRVVTIPGPTIKELAPVLCEVLQCTSIQPAATRWIHARAAGNPFFAKHLAQHLVREGLLKIDRGVCTMSDDGNWSNVALPHNVQRVVISELSRNLTAAQLVTLKIACVIGRSFSVGLLKAVHPSRNMVNDDIEALIKAGYLEATGVSEGSAKCKQSSADRVVLRFKSLLVQEILYDCLPFSRRQKLHRAVALGLEKQISVAQQEASTLVEQVKRQQSLQALKWRSYSNVGEHAAIPTTRRRNTLTATVGLALPHTDSAMSHFSTSSGSSDGIHIRGAASPEALPLEREQVERASLLEEHLSILPQLVHHWCLADEQGRAVAAARAAGKAALLRFAMQEVQEAFSSSDRLEEDRDSDSGHEGGTGEGDDEFSSVLLNSMPWIRGLAQTAAVMQADASTVMQISVNMPRAHTLLQLSEGAESDGKTFSRHASGRSVAAALNRGGSTRSGVSSVFSAATAYSDQVDADSSGGTEIIDPLETTASGRSEFTFGDDAMDHLLEAIEGTEEPSPITQGAAGVTDFQFGSPRAPPSPKSPVAQALPPLLLASNNSEAMSLVSEAAATKAPSVPHTPVRRRPSKPFPVEDATELFSPLRSISATPTVGMSTASTALHTAQTVSTTSAPHQVTAVDRMADLLSPVDVSRSFSDPLSESLTPRLTRPLDVPVTVHGEAPKRLPAAVPREEPKPFASPITSYPSVRATRGRPQPLARRDFSRRTFREPAQPEIRSRSVIGQARPPATPPLVLVPGGTRPAASSMLPSLAPPVSVASPTPTTTSLFPPQALSISTAAPAATSFDTLSRLVELTPTRGSGVTSPVNAISPVVHNQAMRTAVRGAAPAAASSAAGSNAPRRSTESNSSVSPVANRNTSHLGAPTASASPAPYRRSRVGQYGAAMTTTSTSTLPVLSTAGQFSISPSTYAQEPTPMSSAGTGTVLRSVFSGLSRSDPAPAPTRVAVQPRVGDSLQILATSVPRVATRPHN